MQQQTRTIPIVITAVGDRLANRIVKSLRDPRAMSQGPQISLWDEIREKIFKNYALKSIDHVRQKLHDAILAMEEVSRAVEHNPQLVKSITSFPYIAKSF